MTRTTTTGNANINNNTLEQQQQQQQQQQSLSSHAIDAKQYDVVDGNIDRTNKNHNNNMEHDTTAIVNDDV
jgi:hypothetical protein